MSVLRPISKTEYDAWLSLAVPAYAEDKVLSKAWPAAGAIERSAQEHVSLLPHGHETPDHHIYSILSESGIVVGTIWFAIESRGTSQVAYVYNVLVQPEHRRRGHARRAFAALEVEAQRLGAVGIALHVFAHNAAAQALYAQLGFRPTNFNLYKPVGGAGA